MAAATIEEDTGFSNCAVHHSAALVSPDVLKARSTIGRDARGNALLPRHRTRRGACMARAHTGTHRALSPDDASHAPTTAPGVASCARDGIVACTRWPYTESTDRRSAAFGHRRPSHTLTYGVLRQREPKPGEHGCAAKEDGRGCGGCRRRLRARSHPDPPVHRLSSSPSEAVTNLCTIGDPASASATVVCKAFEHTSERACHGTHGVST